MAKTKKVEEKPPKKAVSKKPTAKNLPPVGSSERKSLILQGIIKE